MMSRLGAERGVAISKTRVSTTTHKKGTKRAINSRLVKRDRIHWLNSVIASKVHIQNIDK